MKKGKAKIITLSISALVILVSIIGYTYSYFSASVKEVNKTETIVKTNELNITYTGGQEINAGNMIPGDSFTKTFSVENTSKQAVTFNIYMGNIINEFNEDLVFSLSDEDGKILNNRILPKTNEGKIYLKTKLTIGANKTKNYTLTISYTYLSTEVQNENQGSYFKTILGIDALQNVVAAYNDSIYGIKRDINTSSSAWERIEDAQGLVANAQIGDSVVQNDFDSLYPWNEIITYNYNPTTHQITAYYGEENFKFDGSNGEVLTKIPEFYYKREQKDEYEYIYITKEAQEGYVKSEEFSVGRYTVSGTGENDVHSRSGYQPLININITNFRNYARSLGEGFGQMDYHYFILQILYLVEYADYNSQTKLGLGYTDSSNIAPAKSGGCNALGMKSGTINNDGKHSVIYRGIEDIYGNVWQWVDGINTKNHQTYICYNQDEYEIDKFDGCYQSLGYTNATNDAYVSKLGYDPNNPLVSIPIEVNGTNNTYIGDQFVHDQYFVQNGKIAAVGGRYVHGSIAGLYTWHVGHLSDVSGEISSRLIKIN